MSAIGDTIHNQVSNDEPRVLLRYLGSILIIITGLSQADALFVPFVSQIVIGAGLIYLLAYLISNNRLFSILTLIFFSSAISSPSPHQITFFSFVNLPLLFLVLVKYLQEEIPFSLLLIITVALFISYPPMSFLILIFSGVYLLWLLIQATAKEDKRAIFNCSFYFLLIPLTILFTFICYQQLVDPYYRGFYLYMKNATGFWRSDGSTYFLFLISLTVLLLFFFIYLLPFYHYISIIKRVALGILKIKEKTFYYLKRYIFTENILQRILKFSCVFLFGDLFLYLFFSKPFPISVSVLSSVLAADALRDIFLAYLPFLVIASLGIIYIVFYTFRFSINKYWFVLVLPVFFLFGGAIPTSLTSNFGGSRGLVTSYSLVFILFSIVFGSLIYYKIFLSEKGRLLFINLILIVSLFLSIVSTNNFYASAPDLNFIQGMKWLDKSKISNQIFYISPNAVQLDPPDSRFYGNSLVYSNISFYHVLKKVNQEKLEIRDFKKFISLLNKNKADYIVVEPGYDKDFLNKLNKSARLIFENEGISIYRYLSGIDL